MAGSSLSVFCVLAGAAAALQPPRRNEAAIMPAAIFRSLFEHFSIPVTSKVCVRFALCPINSLAGKNVAFRKPVFAV
jgi:hypothetical protein